MGFLKWIGGYLGWVTGGPIGALIGYLLGKVVDNGLDSARIGGGQNYDGGQSRNTGGYSTGGRSSGGYSAGEQRNNFLISLLVLSSAVIRADGRFLQSETEYVKGFVRRNFGDAAVSDAMRILDELNRKEINIYQVGAQIAANMNYSQRLQLFHYLVELANADGEVCKQEKSVLEAIASALGINSGDAASVIAMFYKDTDSAYAVLEISPSASDEEIKSAYRRMAMKNHPDKVASLGPDVQKAAEEKFRKIQEAYERIKKERGMA